MSNCQSGLFQIAENEEIFKEILEKLKLHPFESPWRMCFEAPELVNEVREITLPELDEANTYILRNEQKNSISNPLLAEHEIKDDCTEIDTVILIIIMLSSNISFLSLLIT